MLNSESPNVLHFDDGSQWRGGQHQVALLAEGLAARGVRQCVWTPEGSPLHERMRSKNIECFHTKFRGEWDWMAARVLSQEVLRRGTNILHAHTAHSHALAVSIHRRLSRTDPKWSGSVLSTRRVDFPVKRGFFSRRKYLYPHQHFIAISSAVRDELLKGGVSPEYISLVWSGVPPLSPTALWSREKVRTELKIELSDVAIVNVGALTDHKGHRWLIEAAPAVIAAHPQASFWILGEGELRAELETQIKRLGLESKVHLCGHVPDARHKLAGFDLYVSSSHLEGLGTANLDAILAGLPIVAAASGGVTDIIRDGEDGLLVAARDAGALATGINRMLDMDDASRCKLISSARQRVESQFSASAMVEGTMNVYAQLLTRAARQSAQ